MLILLCYEDLRFVNELGKIVCTIDTFSISIFPFFLKFIEVSNDWFWLRSLKSIEIMIVIFHFGANQIKISVPWRKLLALPNRIAEFKRILPTSSLVENRVHWVARNIGKLAVKKARHFFAGILIFERYSFSYSRQEIDFLRFAWRINRLFSQAKSNSSIANFRLGVVHVAWLIFRRILVNHKAVWFGHVCVLRNYVVLAVRDVLLLFLESYELTLNIGRRLLTADVLAITHFFGWIIYEI